MDKKMEIPVKAAKRMIFVMNALENGWTVRKRGDGSFVFSQKRDAAKREVFQENYLETFIHSGFDPKIAK